MKACIANHRRPRHFVEWAFQQIILKIRTRSSTRQLRQCLGLNRSQSDSVRPLLVVLLFRQREIRLLDSTDVGLSSIQIYSDLTRTSPSHCISVSKCGSGGFSRPATLPRQENNTRQAFCCPLWKRSPLTSQRRKASESLLTSNCCGSFQSK